MTMQHVSILFLRLLTVANCFMLEMFLNISQISFHQFHHNKGSPLTTETEDSFDRCYANISDPACDFGAVGQITKNTICCRADRLPASE